MLLFTDLANPTSNGLYQRIGYRPVADFAVYDFQGGRESQGGQDSQGPRAPRDRQGQSSS